MKNDEIFNDRILVKGYGFFSFAQKVVKYIVKI